MKKFILCLIMAMVSVIGINAQTALQEAKILDNTYVGVHGGVSAPLDFNSVMPLNANAGIKLGKNFSPVFGANVEGTAVFGDNHFGSDLNSGLFVKATYVGLNGTINLTNLLLGYNPSKTFEVSTEAGIGWLHYFNHCTETHNSTNDLGAKTGVILAWNLGSAKAWQIGVEPVVYWNLSRDNKIQFNKSNAQLAVEALLTYKFKTSNGTHNFKKFDVGALNDEINSLKTELAKKPKTVEVIKEVVKVVDAKQNTWTIVFDKGKSTLSDAAKAELNKIGENSVVTIVGEASPEGSAKFNKKLSEARANAVANALLKRGVKVDSVKGIGASGTNPARTATVTLK